MRTSKIKEDNKNRNWWKWAFIAVVAVLFVGTAYLYTQITAPVQGFTSSTAPKKTDTSFEVNLNAKQVNALADNYLTKLQKGQKVKYKFHVGKQATLTGTTKFLGAKVNFALNFAPKKLSNGNVLLEAKGLAVGRLTLPITYVMGYVKNNYKVPYWVKLNQKKKTVMLDLNAYSKKHSLHYSAENIDMKSGQFRFLVTVPQTK